MSHNDDPTAIVTGADVDYVGSITLDRDLMATADIREFEQVAVLDIDNGAVRDVRDGRRARRRGS